MWDRIEHCLTDLKRECDSHRATFKTLQVAVSSWNRFYLLLIFLFQKAIEDCNHTSYDMKNLEILVNRVWLITGSSDLLWMTDYCRIFPKKNGTFSFLPPCPSCALWYWIFVKYAVRCGNTHLPLIRRLLCSSAASAVGCWIGPVSDHVTTSSCIIAGLCFLLLVSIPFQSSQRQRICLLSGS